MPSKRNLRRSKGGQMPFALIAVTLLLLGSAYGVVCANIERTEETTNGIIDELKSIDDAVFDAEYAIETGLGSIIDGLSTDKDAGTLPDRVKKFDSLSDSWMAKNFPMTDRGITTKVIDHDFKLTVETLKLSSGDELTDSSFASYLKATGTATLLFISSTGSTEKTVDISADGTSALPFLVNDATKFELSAEGGSSILTQMMSYQLTALAQTRVANGYGSLSQYGERGTDSIITEKDVKKAFENSISALETICFRTGDSCSSVDLGEKIVLEDGYYHINVSAIIAQTLRGISDVLITRWLDLFIGDISNLVLDAIDALGDFYVKYMEPVFDDIGCFFTGHKEDRSARKLIRDAMNSDGFNESIYRYVNVGGFSITIPEGTYGASQTHIDGFTMQIGSYSGDSFDWGGWDDFKNAYRDSTNQYRELIKSSMNYVCVETAKFYGSYDVKADAFDSVEFTESFRAAVRTALDRTGTSFTDVLRSGIETGSVPEPMYAAIYGAMKENENAIFKEDAYRSFIRMNILAGIANHCGSSLILDSSITDDVCAAIQDQIDRACETYSDAVESHLEIYEMGLTSVSTGCKDIIEFALIKAGQLVLSSGFVQDMIDEQARNMIDDIISCLELNADCGITDLGKDRSYTLYDGNGNTYEEFVDVVDSYNSSVKITSPAKNPSKCFHNVGFDNISLSAFTAVFTVEFKADVRYTATGMSAVDKALGRCDSAFSGSFSVNTTLDIPCVSGWELSGVKYKASETILDEAWKLILKLIDPIIEPLRELFDMVQRIFEICSTAVAEIVSELTDLITRLYDALEGPLADMLKYFEDGLFVSIANSLGKFDLGIANQKLEFDFFGCKILVEMKLASMLEKTKNIAKITLTGNIGDMNFTAFVDMKYNQKNGMMIKCGGGLENDDWGVNVAIDPLLKFGNTLVSVNGTLGGLDFSVSMPQKVLYDEAELSLSDIPGVAQVLSNIPLPIPGMKGSFDMGFDIKYNLPINTGLMVNEFESNPAGPDNGAEWVELYNGTGKDIDLSGYKIVAESSSKAYTIENETIPAFGVKVFNLPGQFLNNAKSGKHNGESVSLYDAEDKKIDSTPWKKDTNNDNKTWQRSVDGSSTWTFADSTMDRSNGAILGMNDIKKEFIYDNLVNAGKNAFYKMGDHLTSVEDIEQFLKILVEDFIKNCIKSIADMIVSASIFIQLEVTDYAQTSHTGLRVSLEMDSDLIKDGINWLLGQIEFLKDYVKVPKCNDPLDLVCEDTYLRTTVYGSVGAPKFIPGMKGMEIKAGFTAAVNLSSIFAICGEDRGEWKATAGIVFEGLNPALLPTGLKSNSEKLCDLWLISAEFCSA